MCGCSLVGLHGNGLDAGLTLGKIKHQEMSSLTNKHVDEGGVSAKLLHTVSKCYSIYAMMKTEFEWAFVFVIFSCPFMMW